MTGSFNAMSQMRCRKITGDVLPRLSITLGLLNPAMPLGRFILFLTAQEAVRDRREICRRVRCPCLQSARGDQRVPHPAAGARPAPTFRGRMSHAACPKGPPKLLRDRAAVTPARGQWATGAGARLDQSLLRLA
jgi:hypothetical protein